MAQRESDIEQKVRNGSAVKYGKIFTKQKLPLGRKSNGRLKDHRFDFVSDDGGIVGEIKSSKYKNKRTGDKGYNSKRKYSLMTDCLYLEKVKADTKLLVLTNKALHKRFLKDMDGLLSPDIKIVYYSESKNRFLGI